MKRIVVKIGSSILTDVNNGLDPNRIAAIAFDITLLISRGYELVIVSSGAIAAGMFKLGLKEKPKDIQLKQAAAAVGQSSLMWAYEKSFGDSKKKVAQVLLTRDDIADRKRYINSKNTLLTLISHKIIPIINENDTVATDEIKFGDNDNLAALVAGLVDAERLIILSDVDGLYSANPNKNHNAVLINSVDRITTEIERSAGGAGSAVGTGGMYSKILAAKMAVKNGITVNIINGRRAGLMLSVISGELQGTEFLPVKGRRSARKNWIVDGSRAKGSIHLDAGAVKALVFDCKSLLPSGILSVTGKFEIGDAVYCIDDNEKRIAKGISNYSSLEIKKIKGKKTSDIERMLGYRYSDEVIHRDNLVVL